MRAVLGTFALLVGLVIMFMWIHSHPVVRTPTNVALAAVFVLLVVLWFGAEMMFGGGDPNRR